MGGGILLGAYEPGLHGPLAVLTAAKTCTPRAWSGAQVAPCASQTAEMYGGSRNHVGNKALRAGLVEAAQRGDQSAFVDRSGFKVTASSLPGLYRGRDRMGTEQVLAAPWAVAPDGQAVRRGGKLGEMTLLAVLYVGRDAERTEIHQAHAAPRLEHLAGPLEVLAGLLAQDLGLDQVRDGGHDYRFPRFSCSRSIASNNALKLPTPKPRDPCRSMISKKNVGRSWTGRVKIWSR